MSVKVIFKGSPADVREEMQDFIGARPTYQGSAGKGWPSRPQGAPQAAQQEAPKPAAKPWTIGDLAERLGDLGKYFSLMPEGTNIIISRALDPKTRLKLDIPEADFVKYGKIMKDIGAVFDRARNPPVYVLPMDMITRPTPPQE